MTAASARTFTADQLEQAAAQWQADGWVLIERLLPGDQVEAALAELRGSERTELSGPVRRADAGRKRPGDNTDLKSDEPTFRSSQFDGTTLFPVEGCPTLNRLFVDDDLVRFAAMALRTDDLRIYQSRVWSKLGDHTNYEQPMHRDGNHALIPILNEPDWWHMECFVYLQDVDERNGATGIVPGSVARASLTERTSKTADQAPHLYESEVLACGPAGSVLAYRSDVWHRGHDLEPDTDRHIMAVSFKPTTAEWIGFDEHGPLINRPDWITFAEQCTPDQLALFGVPSPGHPYWTAPILDAMATMYPQLDLSPWWDQLDGKTAH